MAFNIPAKPETSESKAETNEITSPADAATSANENISNALERSSYAKNITAMQENMAAAKEVIRAIGMNPDNIDPSKLALYADMAAQQLKKKQTIASPSSKDIWSGSEGDRATQRGAF